MTGYIPKRPTTTLGYDDGIPSPSAQAAGSVVLVLRQPLPGILVIDAGPSGMVWINRDEALALLEKLPAVIAEMAVSISPSTELSSGDTTL